MAKYQIRFHFKKPFVIEYEADNKFLAENMFKEALKHETPFSIRPRLDETQIIAITEVKAK